MTVIWLISCSRQAEPVISLLFCVAQYVNEYWVEGVFTPFCACVYRRGYVAVMLQLLLEICLSASKVTWKDAIWSENTQRWVFAIDQYERGKIQAQR